MVKKRKGFGLVEGMVFLFIFSITVLTFYKVFSIGTVSIGDAKARLGALALANEKMEVVRSLEYDDIGTNSATPAGELLGTEYVDKNGKQFKVITIVEFADDEYDKKHPDDTRYQDYKTVTVKVEWISGGATKTVSVHSTFVPFGIEPESIGGILSLNVIDSQGVGVGQATVRITNPSTVPATDMTVATGNDGNYTFMSLPASNQEYKLDISKDNYFRVQTYAPYPTTPSFVPLDVHASSIDRTLNTKSIILDREVDFTIRTKDMFGADIPDVGFSLVGGRKLGIEPGSAEEPIPVFGYDQASLLTDASGKKEIKDVSPGNYKFTPEVPAGYEFLKVSASTVKNDEFSVSPGTVSDISARFAKLADHSLLVTVVDNASGSPINGATVMLYSTSLGYGPVVLTTDVLGQAFFPTALPQLTPGSYDIAVAASDYAPYGENNITLDGFTKKTARMVRP